MKKKALAKKAPSDAEIPETDFSRGVRGKYAATLRKDGYVIRVYQRNGTFKETRVLGDSVVSLEPDVQAFFPDSRAVNRALRKIISSERRTSHKRLPGRRRSA